MSAWRVFSKEYPHPDDVRMTLGEHLEELRTRLFRAIAALGVGAVVCYVFIDYIIGFLAWPMFAVLRRQGFEPEMTYLNPTEPFVTDLQMAGILGLLVTAPYGLAQIWGFVAAGLYPMERRWVRRFMPVSIGLFFTGALFFTTIVSPALISFLISYKRDLPTFVPSMLAWMIPDKRAPLPTRGDQEKQPAPHLETMPSDYVWPRLPIAEKDDPVDPPEGAPWINLADREIRMRYGQSIYTIGQLKEIHRANQYKPTIRVADYVMFVLQLAAAFGVGFQVPVVVAFLAAVGMATSQQMAEYRKHVIFVMAILAAVITPSPDVTSMMCLLLPMAGLYEIGLVAARLIEKERSIEAGAS